MKFIVKDQIASILQ